MTNLNLSSGFASGMATKGIKISILAFEVANTVVKGANLMNSLSVENVRYLKEEVLSSEGVHLISRDVDELLKIAASDKRVWTLCHVLSRKENYNLKTIRNLVNRYHCLLLQLRRAC